MLARNAWEKRKLSDYAVYRRGSFPQPYGNKEWYNGSLSMPFVQVVDVSSNLRLNESTKQRISQQAQPMSVFVPAHSIVVTLQGSIGRVAITQYDAYVDRTLLIFERFLHPTDKVFFAYVLQKKFSEEKDKAPGGTIKTITKEALSSFEVLTPIISEQHEIGSFLKNLDNLIAATQHKIDALEQAKKALLQRLFDQSWRFKGYSDPWEKRKLGDILNYEQPTPYIVRSENYQNSFPTPVLTAGKSLLLGYTNETNGIKSASKSSPVIIFDDFTTSSHLIDFPFKIKSSAMKILSPSNNDSDIYFSFGLLSSINYVSKNHERHWISQFSNFRVQVPSVHEQACVSRVLLNVTDLIAATQSRLSSLELLKKSLLQGLFI